MATKKWYPRTRTTLAGAGPATITTPLFDCVVVTPGGGVVSVVNLPSVSDAKIQDGEWITFINGGTGADMVLLVPNGAQTISGATFYRIFQKGSVTLQVNQTLTQWQVVEESQGYPTTIVVTADNAGNDANPGTAALPVRTIRKALERLDVRWTGSQADIQLGSAYSDGSGAGHPILIPGPKPGSGGTSPTVKGPAQTNAGFGTITLTGGTASTTSNFRTATFAVVAGLAANAGADFFLRGLSGAINGQRTSVKITTTTSVEYLSTGAALTTGTFQLETPNAAFDQTDEVLPGTGNVLILQDVDINTGPVNFRNLNIVAVYCRLISANFLDCQVVLGGNELGVTSSAGIIPTVASPANTITRGGCNFANLALRQSLSLVMGCQGTIATLGADQSQGESSALQITDESNITVSTVKWSEAQAGVITTAREARLNLSTADLSASAVPPTAAPILIAQRSVVQLLSVTGNVQSGGGATEAVAVQSGSLVEVNAGVSINAGGAANAVRVGANGVKPWTGIGGISTDVTAVVFDGAAVNGGSGVSVRTTL